MNPAPGVLDNGDSDKRQPKAVASRGVRKILISSDEDDRMEAKIKTPQNP